MNIRLYARKTKRLTAMLLAVLLLLTSFAPTVSAADGDFAIEDGVLTAYIGTDESVVIPDGVMEIGPSAFKNNAAMVEITIPSSVKVIQKESFMGCSKLREVHFSAGLERIGEGAFQSCSKLKSVALPEGLKTIGTKAFASYGSQFKWVGIPSTVTQIGSIGIDAFELNYTSLGKPSATAALVDILVASGNTAYYDVDGVLYSSDDALLYAPRGKMGGLEIPSGTTFISDYAFWGSQLDYVRIPEGVTGLGNNVFAASNLAVTNLPSSALDLGENAFYNSKLANIEIADGVTTIGKDAFTSCYSLKSGLVFPSSVSTFGDSAIGDRDSIKWILIHNPAAAIPGNILEKYGTFTVYGVPGSTAQTYADGITITVPNFKFSDINAFQTAAAVTIQPPSKTNLTLDEKLTLTAEVSPTDATANALTWFSTNSTVVSVTQAGEITGKQVGTATICAKTADGAADSLIISVEKGPLQSDYIVNSSGLITGYRGASKDLVIPASVNNTNVIGIADEAFKDMRFIESVEIPGHVLTIGKGAFEGCTALEEVTVQNGVTSIGESAFSGCAYLLDLSLSDSVTAIGASAFAGCQALKEIMLPANLTTIESSLLSGCSDLETATMGNSVTEIKASAFSGCRKLTGITLSTNLTKIGASAFAGAALVTLDVPEGVTDIGNDAFGGCASLKRISFPSTLNTTGGPYFKHMFEQNENGKVANLEAITIADGNANFMSIDGLVYSADGTKVLYCPRGRTEASIAEGVTRIEDYAFFICFDLERVYMPSTLKSIGHDAFHYCEALTYCVLPDGLETIEKAAFFGCESWADVIIPKTVTSIGAFGFCECAAKTIVVPEGITTIEAFAFWGYEETLEYIKLPKTLASIDASAFSWAKKLVYLVIPDGVTTVGGSALGRCDNLTYVAFPNGLSSLGEAVFIKSQDQVQYPCALEGVFIPSTATLDPNTFSGYESGDIMILSNSASAPAAAYAKDKGFSFAVLDFNKDVGSFGIWMDGFNRLVENSDVDPVLTATMTDRTTAAPAFLASAAQTATPGATVLSYFDFSIEKSVNGAAANPILSSAKPMRLIMDIPEAALKDTGAYHLVEVDSAANAIKVLPTTRYENTVHAETNNYSAYALIYVPTPSGDDDGDDSGDDNSGSGNGGNHSSTVPMEKPANQEPWRNPFGDVSSSDWFFLDVEYAVTQDLFNGVSETSFAPNTPMTRGMLVTVLGRLAGVNPSHSTSANFDDVSSESYYAPYIGWAQEQGIVTGIGGSRFAPDAQISRQDICVILARYMEKMEISLPSARGATSFSDNGSIADYAKKAVVALSAGEVIRGKENNRFDPLASATRAEVASILHRFADAAQK